MVLALGWNKGWNKPLLNIIGDALMCVRSLAHNLSWQYKILSPNPPRCDVPDGHPQE